MISITELPLELLLDIIDYLKPIVSSIDSDEALAGHHHILDRLSRGATIFDDDADGVHFEAGRMRTKMGQRSLGKVSNRRSYSDLRALRQTNLRLCGICTPLVYTELDIIPHRVALRAASSVLSHYREHVRYLNIAITHMPLDSPHSQMYQKLILEALDVCPHTTSLAVYSDSGSTAASFTANLGYQVLRLLERGSVSLFGIYSRAVIGQGYSWSEIPDGIPTLLRSLVSPLNHIASIKYLEIASEPIPEDIYGALQANVVCVQSLTLRYCIPRYSRKHWSLNKWAPNSNLTHLRLINCQGAHPAHIPDLVRHFSSLRYLLVTGCGDYFDIRPAPRSVGWSYDQNALWRQHSPLDVFHIELMDEWEILAMGTIPCNTLIATGIRRESLGGCFSKDAELFPCLSLLRVEHTPSQNRLRVRVTPQEAHWTDPISRRKIVIREDARWLVNARRGS